MIKFLLKNLKGTDWEMLTDFVSPVFFEVVPTLGMASACAQIAKDYANKHEFERTKENISIKLGALISNSNNKLDKERPIKDLSLDERKARGQHVLEIYFSQLMKCDTAILDLRTSAFRDLANWEPKAIYYTWQPQFRTAISKMYLGFYLRDEASFSAGLKDLNLSHAAEKFKKHFGEGNQEAVLFKLDEFKKSFHSIFHSCKEHKSKLHPDFCALGVYLVCLYEHLETLDVPLNVRATFTKVVETL